MGKKKNKKKRNKLKYNKSEFIDILCRGCNVCGEYLNPEFCFRKLYKRNPSRFIDHSYKRMIRLKEWPFHTDSPSDPRTPESERNIFISTFCEAGCCTQKLKKGGFCKSLDNCMSEFAQQVEESFEDEETVSQVPRRSKKKNKKKKKEKKIVVQPYPTFFASGSDEFKARVRRILYGPINQVTDNKQAGDDKLPTSNIECGI